MDGKRAALRRRIYEILEVAGHRDTTSRVVDLLLMGLVVLNAGAVWPSQAHRWRSQRLLAILPFYLSANFGIDLRFLRALRIHRILKLTRYSPAMRTLGETLRLERRSLGTALFVLCILSVLVSSGIYVAEHRAQPEAFASIPAAMWWSVVTLTSVGYGDVTPVTAFGKLLGAAVAVVGVCVVALPTGILALGFSDIHRRRRHRLETEAEVALADGYFSQEESESFMSLAERLGVNKMVAEEIVQSASRRHASQGAATPACPHCGKSWETDGVG